MTETRKAKKVAEMVPGAIPPHKEGSAEYQRFVPRYWENKNKRIFFKQTSDMEGSYLECWIGEVGFAHILTSSNLGSKDRMDKWLVEMEMTPSSEEEYESLLAHYFQTVDQKRKVFQEHRDKKFQVASSLPDRQAGKLPCK